METLIPLVKLKGKSLSCNGRRKTFYNDEYMQEGKRGEGDGSCALRGTLCWLQSPCDLDFGCGVLLEGERVEGCGVMLPFPLLSSLSGRGLCSNPETKSKAGRKAAHLR